MSDTLRDQLLGLGFKPAPKPEPNRRPDHKTQAPRDGRHTPRTARPERAPSQPQSPTPTRQRPPKPQHARTQKPAPRSEMDLAKAYAIRAQKEKSECIEAERLKQEAARERREAKARLTTLLEGKALNVADADIARHFPYGGKIKRIYVTAQQLPRLNAGELGVVQMDSRYLLVDAATLALAEATFAQAVALKIDPDAPVENDPYADPQYQVPDDLVW